MFPWSYLPRRGKGAFFCQKLALVLLISAGGANAQAVPERVISPTITAEALLTLKALDVPYRLVDSQNPEPVAQDSDAIRRIYFSALPSFRAAHEAVLRDRNATPAPKLSQRLTGNPADWERLGLIPSEMSSLQIKQPTIVSPKILAEAIQDGVDLQIVDLRAPGQSASNGTQGAASPTPFPGAVRLMPHEVQSEMRQLAKLRWIVLIDGGDRVAHPIAEMMFKEGFALVCVLDGGYPAWVSRQDN